MVPVAVLVALALVGMGLVHSHYVNRMRRIEDKIAHPRDGLEANDARQDARLSALEKRIGQRQQ